MANVLHRSFAMAEVLAEYPDVVVDPQGRRYHAHAAGAAMPDGTWQGWIEFIPVSGGAAVRSGRETTQPNRTDTKYWATGLTTVFLEGALQRALNPLVVHHAATDSPRFDGPAPTQHRTTAPAASPHEAVLDPFAVYEHEGEALLRRRLSALATWHLVRIIESYKLSAEPASSLERLSQLALIDLIARAVRIAEERLTGGSSY